jgi:hypothetical protein
MEKHQDRLDDLSQKLYSPNSPDIVNKKVRPLEQWKGDISHEWKSDDEVKEEEFEIPRENKSGAWVFFAIAIVFAVASFAFAWYYIVNKGNVSANISIAATGPVSIPAGSEYPLEISITNTNSFALELVDLVITYPPGTKKAEVPDEEVGDYREGLGNIDPGQTVTRTVKTLLFSEAQKKQAIIARAEYRIPKSNAIFNKEKQIDVLIESGPVEFVLDTFDESIIGQETILTLHVRSNTDSPLVDILVRADFPQGFTPSSSVPLATYDNNIWFIKTLEPKASTTIKIKGIFTGEADTDRYVRFEAGVPDTFDQKKIASIYASSLEKVTLVKPFLGVDLAFVDGQTDSGAVTPAGGRAKGKITWSNNSTSHLTDITIEAKLSGTALDKKSVAVTKGFYRSIDNKILWSKTTNPEFSKADSGATGVVDFELVALELKDYVMLTKNPEINIDISVTARRPGESGVPEEIKSTVTKKIKVGTELAMNATSLYYVGPFINSGPLPPQPEKETTYTITWTLTNTSNDVSNAQVTAYLPPYVSWNNKISSASERITFDEKTNKITWNPGTISAGTGMSKPSRAASFQVTLFPSTNQEGETPALVTDIVYSGTDSFTDVSISNTYGKEITTRMTNDPNFTTEMEKVGGE